MRLRGREQKSLSVWVIEAAVAAVPPPIHLWTYHHFYIISLDRLPLFLLFFGYNHFYIFFGHNTTFLSFLTVTTFTSFSTYCQIWHVFGPITKFTSILGHITTFNPYSEHIHLWTSPLLRLTFGHITTFKSICEHIREGVKKNVFIWDFVPNYG